jgi:hypothetical protein
VGLRLARRLNFFVLWWQVSPFGPGSPPIVKRVMDLTSIVGVIGVFFAGMVAGFWLVVGLASVHDSSVDD